MGLDNLDEEVIELRRKGCCKGGRGIGGRGGSASGRGGDKEQSKKRVQSAWEDSTPLTHLAFLARRHA